MTLDLFDSNSRAYPKVSTSLPIYMDFNHQKSPKYGTESASLSSFVPSFPDLAKQLAAEKKLYDSGDFVWIKPGCSENSLSSSAASIESNAQSTLNPKSGSTSCIPIEYDEELSFENVMFS